MLEVCHGGCGYGGGEVELREDLAGWPKPATWSVLQHYQIHQTFDVVPLDCVREYICNLDSCRKQVDKTIPAEAGPVTPTLGDILLNLELNP